VSIMVSWVLQLLSCVRITLSEIQCNNTTHMLSSDALPSGNGVSTGWRRRCRSRVCYLTQLLVLTKIHFPRTFNGLPVLRYVCWLLLDYVLVGLC